MDYETLTAKLLTDGAPESSGTENSDPLMNRMEDKYLVSKSFLEKLTSKLRENLKEGESDTQVRFNTTQTIYLDTKDLDCFRDSVSHVKPRFKVRIRHYAPNGGKFEDVAYLELKIKTQEGLTKKTRIRIPKDKVPYVANSVVELSATEELVNLNRDVSPKVLMDRLQTINTTLKKYGFRRQIMVGYNRRAYANDVIRVTVDDNIKYYDGAHLGEAKDLIEDAKGYDKVEKMAERVRSTPYVILEVKHRGTVPAWLEAVMKEVKAERVSFSKYCSAIVDFAKDGQPGMGPISKEGIDVQPLMALFQEPVAKGKKSKDLANIAYVVLRDKNFVLVGKRKNNDKWGLPGGRFEDGEDREEVALRELKEETGIKLGKGDLIYEGKKIVETDDEVKTVYIFSGKHPGGEPKTKDGEFTSWEWMRCENGMLPAKILEEKMNGPTEAAFEKIGLTKSNNELEKASSKKVLFYSIVVPIDPSGRVLVAERKEDGIWTTVAGGANPGESPEQAAVRECFEESGLIVPSHSLEPICVKAAPNGKPVHCFLYRAGPFENTTTRLDPDKEVFEWKWYSKENLPEGLSRQKNLNRLETINQALMKFYGINKADSEVLSLIDKLKKGGEGSGVKGHMTTAKPGEVPQVNKVQAHLNLLRNGQVLPGIKTASGKPIVTSIRAATAQGYDQEDHMDAINAHHKMAMKVQGAIDKMRIVGKEPPLEALEIAIFHEKQMKQHMRAKDLIDQRQKKTASDVASRKTTVKKATTQMGSGLGDRDLDISAYAQARDKAHQEWLERLYQSMHGAQYGDTPTSFSMSDGELHLSKVDDGIYSGYYTKRENGMEDNAKVRIERMTLPELVQFMMAKEWISPVFEREVEPVTPQLDLAKESIAPAGLSLSQPEFIPDVAVANLTEKLQVPTLDRFDRTIKLLELVHKLTT